MGEGVCPTYNIVVAVVSVVVAAMPEQIVPNVVVAQHVVQIYALITFIVNENIKVIEILRKLCAQFREETLSKAQMHSILYVCSEIATTIIYPEYLNIYISSEIVNSN